METTTTYDKVTENVTENIFLMVSIQFQGLRPRAGEFTRAMGNFSVLPVKQAAFPGSESIPNRPPGYFTADYDDDQANRSNAFGNNAGFEIDS